MKYRKKPVIIDAKQFTGNNFDEIKKFCPTAIKFHQNKGYTIAIPTLEGVHEASVNDFIIKGVKGEFYPCKPDIFEMTYEPVEK